MNRPEGAKFVPAQKAFSSFKGEKVAVTVNIVLIVALFVIAMVLFFSQHALKTRLNRTQMLLAKTEDEAGRLRKDKEAVARENERLQSETVSYMALNSDFQKEKDALNARLKELEESQARRKEEYSDMQRRLEAVQKTFRQKDIVQKELAEEKNRLEKGLKDLETAINRERSIYHYNLAVAYTRAGLRNEAVRAYETSLGFDDQNADAYYNLALVYQSLGDRPRQAVINFRRYLELRPDAVDARDVLDSIEELQSLDRRQTLLNKVYDQQRPVDPAVMGEGKDGK
jgi:tetratricopeptide (TPR) repeat protein